MFEESMLFAPLFFVLGALLGSFANVLIVRVPLGEDYVRSRSKCRSCGALVRWYHNVPIFAWFWLKGRCADCKARISFRYPLVELLVATVFVALYLHVGLSWTLLEYLIFSFALITACFIDFDHMILPDIFTLSGIVIALIGGVLNPERYWLDSFLGFLIGGGFLWLIAYLYWLLRKEEGMGGGDIKLIAWIGALLGWKAIPFVIISSSLVGSVVGVTLAIVTKAGLKTQIPFGPYLGLGALLYIFGGARLGHWYIELFLPWLV